MNRTGKLKSWLSLALIALVFHPAALHACSVCYGDPDSRMSKGLLWGIFVLLGVVGMVLAAITTFFVYIAKKSSTETPTDKV